MANELGLSLYPAQRAGVDRYLASPSGRMFLAYGTGCGKTATAILCIANRFKRDAKGVTSSAGPRILVVCPALVRRHWCREFMRWNGEEAFPIEMGKKRRTGSKVAKALRDVAYAARIQVVSYDLLGQVEAEGWDYVVFDEIHHLREATSRQSQRALALFRANPGVKALGLSATLIPTVVKQIWNPLRLFFGEYLWGKANRTGGLSWAFAEQYCGIESNDYGCMPGNGLAHRLPELRDRVSRVAHRITRADIAADLPPVSIRLLDQPGHELGRPFAPKEETSEHPLVKAAVNWRADLGPDVKKVVILAYHRTVARAIHQAFFWQGQTEFSLLRYIDGALPTDKRDDLLAECAESEACVLIATSESLREGVRMMWAENVLLAEWRQSPAQVLQILGRFQSVGSTARPLIDVLYDESMTSEAHTLVDRIGKINAVLGQGETERIVGETWRPKELTQKQLTQLTLDLFGDLAASENRAAFAESEEQDHD